MRKKCPFFTGASRFDSEDDSDDDGDSNDGDGNKEDETEDDEHNDGNEARFGEENEPQAVDEAWKEKLMDEEEPDDPEVKELKRRLDDVTRNRNLEEMRSLHNELHARHQMGRQEAIRRLASLI